MRQAGVLAAAALFALRHNRQRLFDDHRAARRLSEILQDGRKLSTVFPETNIVRIELEAMAATEAVAKLKVRGVLCNATGPRSLRAVSHLDVTFEQVERAAQIMVEELSSA